MKKVTRPPTRALCCECGNLRTVGADYWPPKDGNRTREEGFGDHRGWRWTGTLKCSVCMIKTRHALLRDGSEYRDSAEKWDYEQARRVGGQR
jgi:hypothetical protein